MFSRTLILVSVLCLGKPFSLNNIADEGIAGCISHHDIQPLMNWKGKIESTGESVALNVSLNLGISQSICLITSSGLCVKNGDSTSLLASWLELEEVIEKANKGQPGCYALFSDGSKPWRISTISLRTGMPAFLCPPVLKSGAPTMVLGGFTMHRISGENMDPMIDTIQKIDSVSIFHDSVILDTCMGLGYTAIKAAKEILNQGQIMNADSSSLGTVRTIEYDDASLEIAKNNPWSQALFDGTLPIEVMEGDTCQLVTTMASNSFDCVIHDPPARAICSTDLYGLQFYRQLHRVLKSTGQLYHYIGNPESKESGVLYKGVVKRLREAGFLVPKNEIHTAFGVVAYSSEEALTRCRLAGPRKSIRQTPFSFKRRN